MRRTKVKSHKLYSIIAICSFFMVFLLNGILAYFQDTEAVTNVFTIGEVNIELIEKTTGDALYSTITNDDIEVDGQTVKGIANLVPGQVINKMPYVENVGKNDAYIYMQVKVPVTTISGNKTQLFSYTAKSGWTLIDSKNEIEDGVEYNVFRYSYDNALAINGSTETLFDSITVVDGDLYPSDIALIEDVLKVGITAYAVQTQGVTLAQGYDKFFPVETVGDIKVGNYGQYVDLGTSILPKTNGTITQKLEGDEQPLADWRVFHKDSNGTWLILADYMPNSSFDVTSVGLVAGTGNYSTYGVRSTTSRTVLLNGLNHSNWNNLITGSSVAGLTGVQVKGTVDLDTWKDSWNMNTGYTKLYTDTYSNKNSGNMMSDGLDGYYVGNTENPTSKYYGLSSNTAGYADTLYFPHKSAVPNGDGYWLASPSADETNRVIIVFYSGAVNRLNYSSGTVGVRPVVYLPSNIGLNTEGEVWTVNLPEEDYTFTIDGTTYTGYSTETWGEWLERKGSSYGFYTLDGGNIYIDIMGSMKQIYGHEKYYILPEDLLTVDDTYSLGMAEPI